MQLIKKEFIWHRKKASEPCSSAMRVEVSVHVCVFLWLQKNVIVPFISSKMFIQVDAMLP